MADCDAGHGCSISCPNGCGAVYNESTGKCTKWCEGSFSAADLPEDLFAGKFTISVNDLDPAIMAQALGEQALGAQFKALSGSSNRVNLKLESTDLAGLLAHLS